MREMSKNPEAFGKLINTIVSAIDINGMLTEVVDEIREYMGADRCSLYILDGEKNELYTRVALDCELEEIRVPVDKQSLIGYSVAADTVLNIDDAYNEKELKKIDEDLSFNDKFDKLSHYETRSVLCMAIKHRNKTIGAFQVINKPGGFLQQNIQAMNEFAPIIALAINNAVMEEKLNRASA
ncbi:MAG: GAF domain-containing protein [Deltaproteobacteria bacterium]|nr:GAF domain-containing protein [Deltaproteobacteria bacterium]